MEKKKLTISGTVKKSIKNIEIAKTQGKKMFSKINVFFIVLIFFRKGHL